MRERYGLDHHTPDLSGKQLLGVAGKIFRLTLPRRRTTSSQAVSTDVGPLAA